MSNKYLAHYGVKGMKWHQHIFGEDRTPSTDRGQGAQGGGGSKDEDDIDELIGEGGLDPNSKNPYEKKAYSLADRMKDNFETIRECGYSINNPRVSRTQELTDARRVRRAKEDNERLNAQLKESLDAMVEWNKEAHRKGR